MKKLLIIIGVGLIFLISEYVGLAVYYMDGFPVNTWINGVYCTGSSIEEVNEALLAQTGIPETITVVGYASTGEQSEQISWEFSTKELMLTVDYTSELSGLIQKENPWLWITNLWLDGEMEMEPGVSYSTMSLKQKMSEVLKQDELGEVYYMEYFSYGGYRLYDGLHNRIDEEKAMEAVKNALINRKETVNLIDQGCYYDVPMTSRQEELSEIWIKLQRFQENAPYYDFGAGAQQITYSDMSSFIKADYTNGIPVMDEAGCFILEEENISGWVERVAAETDTYGKTWEFMSTRGEMVSVEGKTYGTVLNRKRETAWLTEYLKKLLKGKSVVGSFETGSENKPRIPDYEQGSYNHGGELGDTYIEVDMGMQKLYYYEEGELLLETDVVTGNMKRRWGTPEGVNYVYNKQKNRILRGETYATPVDYWMPVNGAIGIHDADWRKEFGGDIYLTSGSHGCVNVPKEVMPKLYDMVRIGTPVIMFYGTDEKEE